ncbi:MAG TPA: hypothetical protein GXZ32_07210 [Clostridiales bacterium]|nr:hypothetical protein [Clostridiales bacterium]
MNNEEKLFSLLETIYNELQEFRAETNLCLNKLEERQNKLEEGQNEIKKDLKAVYEQTADLTEFRTETRQGISDIKDTLRFILHKQIETEKELFKLKEKSTQIK